MKIVLTHAYFIHEDVKEQKIMRPYPTLGLLYISAFLKQQQKEEGQQQDGSRVVSRPGSGNGDSVLLSSVEASNRLRPFL